MGAEIVCSEIAGPRKDNVQEIDATASVVVVVVLVVVVVVVVVAILVLAQ